MAKIRTRFAPSPTGPLHMGGVRTALYAYLFAKHHGGDFLLRIEDTDQNRFVEGAEQYIIDALAWCEIKIDEGVSVGGTHAPYRQSKRKEIYRKYAEQLVKSGNAYYAFDMEEDLESSRKLDPHFAYGPATRMKMKNSLTLSKEETVAKLSAGDKVVIRLKVPENEEIKFTDLVRGEVSFNSSLVDDKVLIKGDGMPTYHLAHIVDDYLMEITHAIRGEEWLPSAPAHILIYKFLGWENKMVQYAHLPLLLKPEGNGKLSKRDGDRLGFPVFPLEWKDPASGEISSGYREKGYYPEAFVNMLALLGWNPGTEQEIFSMDELIKNFSFEHVHKAGARFDPEKTKWFNAHYLRMKPDEQLAGSLKTAARRRFNLVNGSARKYDNLILPAVRLLKERVQFEGEMLEKGIYLFEAPSVYDEQVIAKKWKPHYAEFFEKLIGALEDISDFTAANAESVFKEMALLNNLKPGEVLQLFRVILTGQSSGVDLFPMIELLGKNEVCNRIESGLKTIANKTKT
jgi:glutamyl-tRNA synthetase